MAGIRGRSAATALVVAGLAILPAPALAARVDGPAPRPEVVRVTAPRDDGARALVVGAGLLLAVAFGLLAARAVPRAPRAAGGAAAVAPPAPDDPGPPRLAPGAELLGPFQDSGYGQPRFLVRLGDGRMIALTRLAYAVAEQIDGRREAGEIAERAGAAVGRRMGPDDVRFLLRERLRPAGLLAGAPVAGVRPAAPVLSLMLRAAIVPDRPVRAAAETLRHLFVPPVVVAVLAAFVALDVWLLAIHGVGRGVHATAAHPAALLLVVGLLMLSAAFHECGHAAACRYGGATPGAMGVGIYLVWPVFYNDITDSYRLSRAGRLRTDLGGLYFNAIAVLVAGGAYLLTGLEPLLAFVLVQQLQMLLQFAPWVRLDGYYVVSDLAGVPNLFAHVGSSLRGLLPGRGAAAQGRRLTRRAGALVRGWVLTAVPLLVAVLVMLSLHATSTLTTMVTSLRRASSAAGAAVGAGDPAATLWAAVQLGMLLLPVVGLAAFGVVIAGRLGRAASTRWTRLPRVALVALACFAAGAVVPLTLDTVHV